MSNDPLAKLRRAACEMEKEVYWQCWKDTAKRTFRKQWRAKYGGQPCPQRALDNIDSMTPSDLTNAVGVTYPKETK